MIVMIIYMYTIVMLLKLREESDIEAVAEHLSSALLEEFPITKLKMKITKPGAIKIAKEVGIIIQRSGVCCKRWGQASENNYQI